MMMIAQKATDCYDHQTKRVIISFDVTEVHFPYSVETGSATTTADDISNHQWSDFLIVDTELW